MTKIRVLLFVLTLFVVGILGYFAILFAKGYRLNTKTFKFQPKGILVVKSDPTGAQIFIDGNLKGASDSNFSLPPGIYDIDVKKDGYIPWYKRLTIEKESVTEANVSLYRQVPSFTPITISGANIPVASANFERLAYSIFPETENGGNQEKVGLWVMETINFPFGFSKDSKRVTDGDLNGSIWEFSPDGREILLTTPSGIYLLDSGVFTPQSQRINVASKKDAIFASWKKERDDRLNAQIRNLPDELIDILQRRVSAILFSPDDSKIAYTASSSASLSQNLIKPLPGSSTQKEDRDIKIDHTYVYDIKEDRNFLIDTGVEQLLLGNLYKPNINRRLFWLSNSRNLVLAQEGKISIVDYDGTNRQLVYSGSYVSPDAYPYTNSSSLLILTSLGAASTPNLYSLNLK